MNPETETDKITFAQAVAEHTLDQQLQTAELKLSGRCTECHAELPDHDYGCTIALESWAKQSEFLHTVALNHAVETLKQEIEKQLLQKIKAVLKAD